MSKILEDIRVSSYDMNYEKFYKDGFSLSLESYFEKSKTDMCYINSKKAYDLLKNEKQKETVYRNIKSTNDIIVNATNIMLEKEHKNFIINIEMKISSKNEYSESEKTKLKNMFFEKQDIRLHVAFLFGKNNLRFFNHAINIIKIGERYYIFQSWFSRKSYQLIYNFDQNSFFLFFSTLVGYFLKFDLQKKESNSYIDLLRIFCISPNREDFKIQNMLQLQSFEVSYLFDFYLSEIDDIEKIKRKIQKEENIFQLIKEAEIQNLTHRIGENLINYKVITDDKLIGGTKMRGISFFQKMKEEGYQEISFPAYSDGYGQIAVAYISQILGIQAHIFIRKTIWKNKLKETNETQKAKQFGATIHFVDPVQNESTSKTLEKKALEYQSRENAKKKNKVRYVNFGLFEEGYIDSLSENFKIIKDKYNLQPSEIWVASGTGTLAAAISKSFPGVPMNLVKGGFELWIENRESIIKTSENKLKVYSFDYQKIKELNEENIPYKVNKKIDAKIWYFAKDLIKDNALIWNVA